MAHRLAMHPLLRLGPIQRPLALAVAAATVCVAGARSPLLEVRLRNHLTSYSSPPGTRFECVVLRSLVQNGHIVIPKDSFVSGHVRKAQAVGIGIRHERAALELQFDSYRTPEGDSHQLSANLVSIDNAREQVTSQGKIKGILAANNPGNLLNGIWSRPSNSFVFRSLIGLTGAANQVWAKYSMGPFGAAGLFVVRCALISFPEPEIHLPPGTDMKLQVQLAADQLEAAAQSAPSTDSDVTPAPLSFASASDFRPWITSRLKRLSYGNGLPAPDRINIVAVGSSNDIMSAFLRSGWSSADVRSLGSVSRVYRAFSSMQNYASAPVSKLLYDGRPPELVFEKGFDTVTQRHHVRFWFGGEVDGKQVWLGAATHDTGVKFRVHPFGFTHRIDLEIDGERDKVATDLEFSGCSAPPVILNGQASPSRQSGGVVVTDGRLTVLETQSCTEASGGLDEPPPPPGNRLTRITRRVVLEARNYICRDNAYYLTYRVVRGAYSHSSPLLH